MRKLACSMVLLFVFALVAGALVAPSSAAAAPTGQGKVLTTKRLIKQFKKATKGDRLRRDSRASWGGVDALRYGTVASQSTIGRYGHFVLYVARATDEMDVEVDRLLADIHTAEPIVPNRKGVRWEQNVSLRGGTFWTAKTKYGRNVVLVWNGEKKKGVTPAWKRLHTALRKATR